MPTGAWGRSPSDAIRAPPERSDSGFSRNSSSGGRGGGGGKTRLNRQRSGSGRGRGGGGGRGRYHNNSNNYNERRHSYRNRNDRNNNDNSNNAAAFMANVKLLVHGDGSTEQQKNVKRFTAEDLLGFRLEYLDLPVVRFQPSPHCVWDADTRVNEIRANHVGPKKTGDVSRISTNTNTNRRSIPKETAPPLEECKPLEVNEETRWKSKAFTKDGEEAKDSGAEEEADEEILKKGLLILNKLSLTKFDKLSADFVETGIGRNPNVLGGAIGLIVEKAQSEPHFSSMYARLCLKLSKIPMLDGSNKKVFKKMLLTRCQQEFTTDTKDKIIEATKDLTDKEEISYHTNLIRKAYVGHMRFIGELYKCDLIKNEIMLWCLQTLLEAKEEDNIECFAKLMTTIGYSLEQQTLALQKVGKEEPIRQLQKCWEAADALCAGGEVSNRIKFMLLDLKEMKQKGWITRRKEETAKTLDQIHKDVAQEEARARQKSIQQGRGPRRTSSNSNLKPAIDQDGFTTVLKPLRSASFTIQRATSDSGSMPPAPNRPTGPPRRAQSFSVAATHPPPVPKKEYLPLDQIKKKAENLFKEYFVGGDTADAVLTVDELIGAGKPDSVNRGASLIEAAVFLVMERKDEDAKKMVAVLQKCWEEEKLDKDSFGKGLSDPLEFLSDVEIDAPLARPILAEIIAIMIEKMKVLELDQLLAAPEFFLTDGKPALFAAKVLDKMEGETTDSQVAVVEKLMTAQDKKNFPSAKELIESVR